MPTQIEIIPIDPFADGIAAGKKTGRERLQEKTAGFLQDQHLKETLGAMSRSALESYVLERLETVPDYGRYPELEDIYPERLDFLRGFAEGAGCSLAEAAVADYVFYRQYIEDWHQSLQLQRGPEHCGGVFINGPDGVLGGQSAESAAEPRPAGYKHRSPKPYSGLKSAAHDLDEKVVLRRPRTGYIERWGATNEKGVARCASVSCSVWLDEPIEDTWPIKEFPLLRFARDVTHLEELYRRYTLHCWGRFSQVWADTAGDGVIIEKSFRRIGTRRAQDGVLWCTEGHWESPEMATYIRTKRLEYLERAGKHLGAEDMQYATDCAVRFTHLGWLCHQPWGRGYEHIRQVLTNHAPFPRAVCRHGGPDTAPYDESVTQRSWFYDLTHNRSYTRDWVPWKKFPCEVPETMRQFPARP